MPSTETQIKDAVEALKKAQREQFQEVETKIVENLKNEGPVAELMEKSNKISQDVSATIDNVQKLTDQLSKEKTELNKRLDEFEEKYGKPDFAGGRKAQGLGTQFIEKAFSDGEKSHERAYQEKRARAKLEGGAEQWLQKNISTASGSGEALADSLRIPGVITQPEDMLVVQTAIPRTFTPREKIDYVRELAITDNTATVAESTGTGDLQTKPQGNITFELVEETMKTIAQWIPASRQILTFASRTQLQAYIERRLRQKILLELEDQVLLGDGTGQNMTGLVTDATAYNRGYAQISSSDPTELDTLRRAMTQLQLVNYAADRVVLNPADWEDIALLKDSQLRYIFVDPALATAPRVWGIPVSPSNRMTENKFLMGALSQVSELFVGMDVTVEISREHASFFTQNMVAILAEMMATLAIYRPEGLVYGGLTNAES